MSEKTPYPLSKPIKAHGEDIQELMLREGTSADSRVIGEMPYWVGSDESVRLNVAVAMKYLVRWSGVPMSSLDQLAGPDLNALCWKVAGFFLQPGQQASTSSSGLPTT